MKPQFYEAGAFQVVAISSQKGRNNASNHTGQPCPCKGSRTDMGFIESAIRTKQSKK